MKYLSGCDSVLGRDLGDFLLPDAGDGVVPVRLAVPHRRVGGHVHPHRLAVPYEHVLLQVGVQLNLEVGRMERNW